MALTFSPPPAAVPTDVSVPAPPIFAPSPRLDDRVAPLAGWLRLTPILQAAVVLSIWLLHRFYRGIVHDSRIYIGRALADLDPHGLGREPAFLYDEQTKHTIFSHLLVPLVAAFGPSTTSIGVTLAALLIWLAAAAWLASRLAPPRLVPAALICAAVLPAVYGPFDIFSFGEALATPRGFAEAGVLAGLAALMSDRRLLCGGLLLVAALFHPVIAAPGFGVMFLVLAQEDRRWWGLAPLGLIALCAAGALHLGPAKTLFSAYDPAWLRVMHIRNGFLFVADWPPSAWYGAAPAIATLILGAMILGGRRRVVVVAALIGAAAGLATSFVFGDLLGSMLMLQLQLWRTLWIVQVLAVLLVPVCAVELWTKRRHDARLSMVFMGLAWLELHETVWGLPMLAVGLGFAAAVARGGADRVSAKALIALSLAALGFVLAMLGAGAYVALAMARTFSLAHVFPPFSFLLALKLHLPLLLAVALIPLLVPMPIKPAATAMGLALALIALAPLAAVTWDQRTPTRRMTDLGQGRADLNRLIGPTTGTGLVWIPDQAAPWFLLSRATWVSDLQGTIGAFSRPLAMIWDHRDSELYAAGFNTMRSRNPWAERPVDRPMTDAQSHDAALRLCKVKNAPQAIVLAGDLAKSFALGVSTSWHAPVTDVMPTPGASTLKFTPFDFYTVVHCDRVTVATMQRNLTSKP